MVPWQSRKPGPSHGSMSGFLGSLLQPRAARTRHRPRTPMRVPTLTVTCPSDCTRYYPHNLSHCRKDGLRCWWTISQGAEPVPKVV